MSHRQATGGVDDGSPNLGAERSGGLRNTCFTYDGVDFKLVDNGSDDADALMTVVPSWKGRPVEEAYGAPSSFLSAFAWESRARVAMLLSGGHGVPETEQLDGVNCAIGRPRLLVNNPSMRGSLARIAHLETREQDETATLCRVALAATHRFLRFRSLWHTIAVSEQEDVGDWITSNASSALSKDRLARVPAGVPSLGECLREDFSKAIAHYHRADPSRKTLRLDNLRDPERLSASVYPIRKN